MPLRASYVVEIFFGPIPFSAKAYAVAGEKTVPLSQVHGACGGKLEQHYVCTEDGAVVPRPAMAKQLRAPDGTVTRLTEETIKSAESDRFGQLQILECIPEDGIDPLSLGKTLILGPDEGTGIDAYATFVDTLEETKMAAVGVYYGRSRDQLVLIQRYKGRGLLLRELFYANEMRSLDELEFPLSVRGSHPAGVFELWTNAAERLRKPAFNAEGYQDGYPERLVAAAHHAATTAATDADGPTPLLQAARKKAATGSAKTPVEARREKASVHVLPARGEREEESPKSVETRN